MTDNRTPGPADHPGDGRRVRASDAERERVAAALRDAMGEGRLTLDEGEQRLAAAYASTYRDELPRLTADLPAPLPADGTRRPDRPRRPRPGDRLIGLVAVAAVVIGAVALAAGRTLWPAILLGILAVMLVKHRARGRRWHPAGGRDRHLPGPGQNQQVER
jgi:hypothetical protein